MEPNRIRYRVEYFPMMAIIRKQLRKFESKFPKTTQQLRANTFFNFNFNLLPLLFLTDQSPPLIDT